MFRQAIFAILVGRFRSYRGGALRLYSLSLIHFEAPLPRHVMLDFRDHLNPKADDVSKVVHNLEKITYRIGWDMH